MGEIAGEAEENPGFPVSSQFLSHGSMDINISLNTSPETMTGPGGSSIRATLDCPHRVIGGSGGGSHSDRGGIRAWLIGCFACSGGSKPPPAAEDSAAANNLAFIHLYGFEAHPASMMAPTTADGDMATKAAQPQGGGAMGNGWQPRRSGARRFPRGPSFQR